MAPALPRIASLTASSAFKQHRAILRLFSTQPQRQRAREPEDMMKMMPPKPEPPSNEDCCMSGCDYCVWDLYDEDMHEYQKHATEARQAFEAQGKPVPEQLRPENLRDSMDPSMRAFLAMEREMAMRIQHEEDENKGRDDE